MGEIKVMKAIEQVEQLNHFIENQDSLPHLFSIWKDAKLGKTCFSSSLGQEDQVLTDYIFRNSLAIDVFTLDTGRLFQETYDTLSSTVQKYKREIKCALQLERLAKRRRDYPGLEVLSPEAVQFRWMLEEFRVSLFAQQLGTKLPVSAKRLDQQWQSVEQWMTNNPR